MLKRIAWLDEGAFGVLLWDGRAFAVTIERTYPPTNFVKIPPGLYTCRRTVFHHGKPNPYETFEIMVPGHDRILFHRANYETDLDGCVGVAKCFEVDGRPRGWVSRSFEGHTALMDRAAGLQELTLEVI